MAQAVLPRRDAQARRQLAEVGRAVRPLVLARDRIIPVAGPLAELLPEGALVRGSVVVVDGVPGGGSTALALELGAAVTSAGEWAAVVDPAATLGGLSVLESGAAAERFVVVRGVRPQRWAKVVAGLLEGMGLVVGLAPPPLGLGDARRLLARAREHGAVLVVRGAWPAEAALRLSTTTAGWSGLESGSGWLGDRARAVRVEQHGVARAGLLSGATG